VSAVGDDSVTMPGSSQVRCVECGRSFLARGRARFCGQACRQRSYRARQTAPAVRDLAAASKHRDRNLTVYECGRCGERSLGGQRCESCGVFGTCLGYGLPCSACGDLLVLNELLAQLGLPELPVART
jgi:hypothetical protein